MENNTTKPTKTRQEALKEAADLYKTLIEKRKEKNLAELETELSKVARELIETKNKLKQKEKELKHE